MIINSGGSSQFNGDFLKGTFYDGEDILSCQYIRKENNQVTFMKPNLGAYSLYPIGQPVKFPYIATENIDFYKQLNYTYLLYKSDTSTFLRNSDGTTLQKTPYSGRDFYYKTTTNTTSFPNSNQSLFVNTNEDACWKIGFGYGSSNGGKNSACMYGPIDVSNYSLAGISLFECNISGKWQSCGAGFSTTTNWTNYQGSDSLSPYIYWRARGINYYKNIYGEDFTVADVLGNEQHGAWERIEVDVSNLDSIYLWLFFCDGQLAIKDIYLL